MRVRLNGWQRIGIVLSVIWAVTGCGIGSYEANDNIITFASGLDHMCRAANRPIRECDAEFTANYRIAAEANPVLLNWAIFGFAPIPLAWLIVYAFIGLWRWIRRGFNT